MELPRTETDHGWLTVYLYFDVGDDGDGIYGEAADRVIRDVVAPLVKACRPDAVRWFFLRYSEDGAHVRVRAPAALLGGLRREL